MTFLCKFYKISNVSGDANALKNLILDWAKGNRKKYIPSITEGKRILVEDIFFRPLKEYARDTDYGDTGIIAVFTYLMGVEVVAVNYNPKKSISKIHYNHVYFYFIFMI